MPDYSTEIANLEEILNAGATSMSVDGVSTTVDLAEVRRRLAQLQANHDGDDTTADTVTTRQRLVPYKFS